MRWNDDIMIITFLNHLPIAVYGLSLFLCSFRLLTAYYDKTWHNYAEIEDGRSTFYHRVRYFVMLRRIQKSFISHCSPPSVEWLASPFPCPSLLPAPSVVAAWASLLHSSSESFSAILRLIPYFSTLQCHFDPFCCSCRTISLDQQSSNMVLLSLFIFSLHSQCLRHSSPSPTSSDEWIGSNDFQKIEVTHRFKLKQTFQKGFLLGNIIFRCFVCFRKIIFALYN